MRYVYVFLVPCLNTLTVPLWEWDVCQAAVGADSEQVVLSIVV